MWLRGPTAIFTSGLSSPRDFEKDSHTIHIQATMCEQISFRHRCGHLVMQGVLPCNAKPKSIDEQTATRIPRLKGLPPPLPWYPSQSSHSVDSRRLCSDCRREKRRETWSPDQQHGYDQVRWRDWKSKEGVAEMEKRKMEEAELECRWIKHGYGKVCW